MTTAPLRVPHATPLFSPTWFSVTGGPAGFAGNTVNSAYYNGNTYIGSCDGDGAARVIKYNHASRTATISPQIVTGLGADVHCIPSVLVRSSDHKLLIAVSPHNLNIGPAHMFVAVSTNAEDVSAWGAATDIVGTLGASGVTYANLFQLSGESGKIYLFYRDEQNTNTTSALCYSTSTDGGSTWAAQTTLYKAATNSQPYWAIQSDDTARIDFVIADGSAGNSDPLGSVYHFYYSGGSWLKSDGTSAGSPTLAPASVTKVYDGATNGLCRAPYAIITNSGNPVAVWAAYNHAGAGSNENYWYGTCSSGTWTVNQIDNTGSVPDVFQEGGLCIDVTNLNRVFLSKKTSSVWQIYKYETSNGGSSWTTTQLTSDTSGTPTDDYNMRPVSPRNANAALTTAWCFGPHPAFGSAEIPEAIIRGYPHPPV